MSLVISIITNAVFVAMATLFLNHYLNKNLQKRLEELKSRLQIEQVTTQEMLNKKRQVYIDLVESMTIFIGQRIPTEEQLTFKRKFLNAYDASWLWASDSVLKSLSDYMDLKLKTEIITEVEEKAAFANVVMEMRKDLGFSSSQITIDDYKFINL